MGRLIDEDLITRSKELTKKIVAHNLTPYIKVDDLIDFIDSLPTAYDVDKVVEQIKTLSKANYVTKDDVLKIVKGGGVNE